MPASDIAAIQMGSRARDEDTKPGQLGAPIINVATPTSRAGIISAALGLSALALLATTPLELVFRVSPIRGQVPIVADHALVMYFPLLPPLVSWRRKLSRSSHATSLPATEFPDRGSGIMLMTESSSSKPRYSLAMVGQKWMSLEMAGVYLRG